MKNKIINIIAPYVRIITFRDIPYFVISGFLTMTDGFITMISLGYIDLGLYSRWCIYWLRRHKNNT